MAISILRGRSGSGKSACIEEAIVAEHAKGRPCILVVPDQSTFEAETRLMALLGGGLLDVEVLGFTRLSKRVLDQTGGAKRLFLSEDGKKMALRKIIEENQAELKLFGDLGPRSGFVEQISGFFKTMKFGQLGGEELRKLSQSVQDELLRMKLGDIALLYDKMQEFMAGRYIDAEDAQNLLIERIPEAEFLKESAVFIDGISAKLFSAQSLAMLAELMRYCHSLCISICLCEETDPDAAVFAQQRAVYRKIKQLAMESGRAIEEVSFPIASGKKRQAPPALQQIEKHLFSYEMLCFSGKEAEGLCWMEAPSQREEVEQAALYVDSLLRRGNRCNDISIAMGDPALYGPFLKRAMPHLPLFLDERRALASHGVVELSLASLDVVLHNYRREDLLRVIKSGFSPLSIDQGELLETFALEFGINFQRWTTPFEKMGAKSKEELEEKELLRLEAAEEARQMLLAPLENLKKRLGRAKSAEECAKALFDYFEDIALRTLLDERCQAWEDAGEWDFAQENAQVWHILMELLDQIATLIPGSMSAPRFKELLEEGCVSHKIGMIPSLADQIVLGDVSRLATRDCEHLIVLGCNEGMIPAVPPEAGLIDDRDIEQMRKGGVDILPDQAESVLTDRQSVYALLSRPKKSLYLSWSKSDKEGNSMYPSEIAERIQALFPDQKKQYEEKNIMNSLNPEEAFVLAQKQLREAVDGDAESATDTEKEGLLDALAYFEQEVPYASRLQRCPQQIFEPQKGMNAQNPEILYRFAARSSVSRLERFNDCPFRHYVQYALRPKERKELKEEASDQGNYFHEAFDRFTKTVQAGRIAWKDINEALCESMMEQVLDEIEETHNNEVFQSTARNKAMGRRLRRTAQKTCLAMVKQVQAGEFYPLMSEAELGGEGENALPPLKLPLGDGREIELLGKIDRVDCFDGEQRKYIRIIDYKSGYARFSFDELYYGLKMQLPIYCAALREHLGVAAGMFYLHVVDDIPNEEALEKLGSEAQFMRPYRLDGILLADKELMQAMDAENSKLILPGGLKADGEIEKKDCLLPIEQMEVLIDFALEKAVDSAERIFAGETAPNPIDFGGRTSCDHCNYQGICRLEAQREGRFRSLKKVGAKGIFGAEGGQ